MNIKKLFSVKTTDNERRFSPLRTIISCVLIAAVLISTSIGLGYSKIVFQSQPLDTTFNSFVLRHTHNAVLVTRVDGEDSVMEFDVPGGGKITCTVDKNATGKNITYPTNTNNHEGAPDYYVLAVGPSSTRKYEADYNVSTHQFTVKFQLTLYSVYRDGPTIRMAQPVADDADGMITVKYKVGSDVINYAVNNPMPSTVNLDYDGESLTFSNFTSIYQSSTGTFALSYDVAPWLRDADLSWYDGSGSYTLTTAEQLAGFSKLVNSGNNFAGETVSLGGDVALTSDDVVLNESGDHVRRPWIPIGTATHPFAGSFEGNGYTVSGLNIPNFTDADGTPASERTAGFFGYVDGDGASYIRNLTLSDVSICAELDESNNTSVGAVAGYCDHCTVSGINVSNLSIHADAKYIGGIVGVLSNDASVSYCDVQGSITPDSSSSIGGIVGIQNGNFIAINVSYCNAVVDFAGGYAGAGGIVGFAAGNGAMGISDCTFRGSFDDLDYSEGSYGAANVGGIINVAVSTDAGYTIDHCYCYSDVPENRFIVANGYTDAGDPDEYEIVNVTNCSWAADVDSYTWYNYDGSRSHVVTKGSY